MRFKSSFAIIIFASLVLFTSCHSKVDLKNIDSQAKMELGIALPIGTLHATFGDFIGSDLPNMFLDADGVYHLLDTIDVPAKKYHKVDLTAYLLENKNELDCKVKDQIDKSSIDGDGHTETLLEFPLTLSTANFNQDETNERVDSIFVRSAQFYSVINVEDFDLDWSEISRVELVLDKKQFHRQGGHVIDVPIKEKGYGYNKEIPIDVTNFSISIMDEKKGGTVEHVNYTIRFYVCPNAGHNVAVSDNSKFKYDLKVQVVNYDAIWGFFQAGNELRDKERFDMDSIWEGWRELKKLKLRFMEPEIDLYITHHIAAPLRITIDTLVARDSMGLAAYANWNGSHQWKEKLPNCLSPFSPSLKDSVDNHFHFSYKAEEGHLDELFNVRPDFFEYSYYVEVDPTKRSEYPWDQHRITEDVKIRSYAIVDVPLKLDQGSELEYTSLKEDVSISSLSLDSLEKSIEVLDDVNAADIKLIIHVENSIPFTLDAYFTFLDKNGNDLKLKLIEENNENHLTFPAAKMTRAANEKYGHVTEPSVARYTFRLSQEELNRLSEATTIDMHVAMVDNPEPCLLTDETGLKVQMGLSAHVDAVFDFGKVSNENNTK